MEHGKLSAGTVNARRFDEIRVVRHAFQLLMDRILKLRSAYPFLARLLRDWIYTG
jgi:hypothetical protein